RGFPMRAIFFPCIILLCVFLCVLCDSVVSYSQPEQPKHIAFRVRPEPVDPFSDQNVTGAEGKFEVRRGETFLVVIEGTPQERWHTYPITKQTESQSAAQLTQLRVSDSKDFANLWPITESEPELKAEEGTP